MTHAEAVQAEMKRWRLYHGEDALILAFCACVGMKMKGGDMDDILQPPNDALCRPAGNGDGAQNKS